MRHNPTIEERLNSLGYKLVERLYPWSLYTVIIGPDRPNWTRIFKDYNELNSWLIKEERYANMVGEP